ncbi:MAG: MFS transporter [Alkalispirochaetaceae bacterium]
MSRDDHLLTRTERIAGRRHYLWFGVFNAASFNLLTSNLITLYLLRLEASRTVVGLVASFGFASFLVSLLGRNLVPRFGLIRLFSGAWFLRNLSMVPAVAAPVIASRFGLSAAVVAVVVAAMGFQFFRGLGLVANSPVTGVLSDGPDRGAYLGSLQIRIALSSAVTGLGIVFFVDPEASLGRYALLVGAGILFGMVAAIFLALLPEPPGHKGVANRGSIADAIFEALREAQFRRFFAAFTVFAVATGIYRSFLVVTAKQVYGYSDREAYLLSVIGFLGTLAMGLLSRLLTDRIGAKPMTLVFLALIGVGTLPLVVLPQLAGVPGVVLLGGLFFLVMLGVTGAETTTQAYFLAMVPPGRRLELGLFFFLALGIGGTVGSAFGGALLDLLIFASGLEVAPAFRLFYLAALALLMVSFLLYNRLERMGAYSFRGALAVLFSLRELRAINLVNRLDESESIGAGRKAIKRLGSTESTIATSQILKALDSPSFVIRNEAMYALAGVRWTEEVETALIEELRRNEFTTAQQAARLLGKRGSRRAVEPLRAALDSHDYLLQAKAAVALARLGDTESLDRVGEIIHTSTNPLVVIHAAAALRLYEDPRGLRRLLHGLTRREIDPYVADEIIIDAATILGIGSWFYRLYARFTRSPEEGRDEVAALLAEGNREIMDALVSAAKGELIEEGATQSGASRRSQARSLLIEEIRSLASEAPEPLARGMEGLAYEEVVYPGRLLILLLAAHSVENIPIE